MQCAESLMQHPSSILSNCFDHMCEDLDADNIIGRLDKNINALKLAKAEILIKSAAKNPESSLQREWRMPFLKLTTLQEQLILMISILLALIFFFDDELSNPYVSLSWFLLQTFGSMFD